MWLDFNQGDPLQGCQFCHCCYVAILFAPDVISHPHKPQTIAWAGHRLLIGWHGTAVSLIMRQSLIRVLQRPASTAVSHYLQIQLGPAPRLTNANQRPDAQLRFFYFITYIQLNIGSPHAVDAQCYAYGFGCSSLFVRYRWSVASAVVYDKKKGIWRQHIATSS